MDLSLESSLGNDASNNVNALLPTSRDSRKQTHHSLRRRKISGALRHLRTLLGCPIDEEEVVLNKTAQQLSMLTTRCGLLETELADVSVQIPALLTRLKALCGGYEHEDSEEAILARTATQLSLLSQRCAELEAHIFEAKQLQPREACSSDANLGAAIDRAK